MARSAVVLIISGFLFGCGVKGDPQPPQEMPELGRGRPTFDKASKELMEKEKSRDEEEKNKRK